MPCVLVFGTFDVFHAGHEFFLRRAAELGELHVIVAPDAHVRLLKNHEPTRNETLRLATIQRLPYVKDAQLGDAELGTYGVVEKIHPDLIVLGHDQTALGEDLKRWMGKTGWKGKIVKIEKTT